MEDGLQYGKPVYKPTKDSIAKYAESKKKIMPKIYILLFFVCIFFGVDNFLYNEVEKYNYFYLVSCGSLGILMLIMSQVEKKRLNKIDYNKFYACVYEKGFVVKDDNAEKVNINVSFDEIRNINREITRHHVRMVVYKKLGDEIILSDLIFGDYMDVNIFYKNLKRAFKKYNEK